jgi:CheY-like chemotaxis protein
MTNGIKYNRPNGSLKLDWQQVHKHDQVFWQLTIEDTGLGIAAQDLPQLFEPFNRLGHEGSNIEGTGIGLSITKDLVEQMGGWIDVESQVNVGTRFIVSLPLDTDYVATPNGSKRIEAPDENQAIGQSNHMLKILYVEDNPVNMKLMVAIAKLIDNVELRIAPSAENGLQQAKAWLPPLILLDINLPGMNGDEAIAHFKALPGYQQTPPTVFAITANVLAHQVAQYVELGFDQVIAKPFDLQNIINAVESVRDRKCHVG